MYDGGRFLGSFIATSTVRNDSRVLGILNNYKELASGEQIPFGSGHDTMSSISISQPMVGVKEKESLITGLFQSFGGVQLCMVGIMGNCTQCMQCVY